MFKRFSERIKVKSKKYTTYLVIFLILIFGYSLVRNVIKVVRAQRKIQEAKDSVEKLKKENDALKQKVEEAKSQEFIEKQLRDKLGLSREGEIVIVLPDEETLRKIAPLTPEEEDSLPDPTWKKWLKLFLD